MAANDQKAKKGDAAPLEGVVGREIMFMLNMAFLAIGATMISGLGMKMGAKLGGPALAGKPAASMAPSVPGARGPAVSNMSAPRPRGDMQEP